MKKLLSILLLALSMNANAQSDGSLDTSFNHTGKVTTSIAGYDQAYGVAIQSDGKIIAVGLSYNGTDQSVAIARYNANGTPDNTFGTGGTTITDLGPSAFGSQAQGVVIQADGKIVAGGRSFGGSGFFTIIRYNTNGIIDSTFGTFGIENNAYSGLAYAVALQADQKIVAAGSYNIANFCLARYNTNGSPDNTFGTGSPSTGVVTTAIGSSSMSTIYGISIQADQKIVVAGNSQNGSDFDFTLARYKTNGSIDSTFGTNGVVTTAIGITSTAYSLSIQSDGKIIVAGSSGPFGSYVFALARYDSTGSLDATFGTGGTITTAVGSGSGYALGVSIQKDGKLVAAGFAGNYFALARYSANGVLDNTFGTGGKVTTDVAGGGNSARGNAVALQANGKIVLAGYTDASGVDQFALARYNDSSSTTGIVDYNMESAVNIYPNPAHDRIYIESLSKIEETDILDITGREIQVYRNRDAFQISIILPVNEGVYFVRIKTEEGTTVRKVIKGI